MKVVESRNKREGWYAGKGEFRRSPYKCESLRYWNCPGPRRERESYLVIVHSDWEADFRRDLEKSGRTRPLLDYPPIIRPEMITVETIQNIINQLEASRIK